MIKCAVTVSLVPEARGGPFVFWDDLPATCRKARELGFDAIELFAPGPDAVKSNELEHLLNAEGLRLAALGTGAGWVKHQLHLCLPDGSRRHMAQDFIRSMLDLGGRFAAPVIVGSMQGRWGEVSRGDAAQYVAEALNELGDHAGQYGVPVLFEPLNRYETNIVNTIDAGLEFLQTLSTTNVRLLADLYHMNIEEVDIAGAIRSGGERIGHVHFADSNRRPAGCGHIDFAPIAAALKEIGFDGFVSAEALPYPDSDQAAKLTIEAYRRHFQA